MMHYLQNKKQYSENILNGEFIVSYIYRINVFDIITNHKHLIINLDVDFIELVNEIIKCYRFNDLTTMDKIFKSWIIKSLDTISSKVTL